MGAMKEILLDERAARKAGGSGGFARIKSMFFDRQAVIGQMDAATRKMMNYFGGLCMKIARNSIRSTDAISQPGRPPSSHVGAQNRRIRAAAKKGGYTAPRLSKGIKEIYYSYDPHTKSVVVGPIAFNSSQLAATAGREGLNVRALELLEYGGDAMRRVKRFTVGGATVWAHSLLFPEIACIYRPRPFMGPAFEKTMERLPAMWAGGVK